MKRLHSRLTSQSGFVLVYMAAGLTTLLLFSGLAVDSGRAYLVKAQLTKAVDGAALAAARNLNSGNPRLEAARVFEANFPDGYLGTTSATDPMTEASFFSSSVDNTTGVNTVHVRASATLPTTFMNLSGTPTMVIGSEGEATRRMVDLSLVLDVSSSIGGRWGAVRDAARTFARAFDQVNDRFALITYGNGAMVREQMRSTRGFDKTAVVNDIPNTLPGGSTAMVEGLYRGWDELRTVPQGQQSGLRVIVLFTDGASNSVPGMYDATGVAKGLRTYDFPKNLPDPDNQTHNNPNIQGLYDTQSGSASPAYSLNVANWNDVNVIPQVPLLPLTTWHAHRRSPSTPQQFPLQTSALTVNGTRQDVARALRQRDAATGRYPAQVFNINNAARNVLEIIANEARNDNGDYPIRIFTIGMGELVRYNLGTMPEKPEDILKRVANDSSSPDFNDDQLEGEYYFAQTEADVAPAFQALQNQIIRLSR